MRWLKGRETRKKRHSSADLRLVQRACEAHFLGLEIGASQSTLPVGAKRFRRTPHIGFLERFWRYMPQFATVGLVGGFRDDGASGAREEPAGFRRNFRACRLLRYSGPVRQIGRAKCRERVQ